MTQWVTPSGGRRRGPLGIAIAWVAVLTRPREFFERSIAAGDQGPGLTFLVAVVLVAQGTRFALGVDTYPVVAERPLASALFWLLVVAVLVAPLALHVVAALQTVLLAIGTAGEDRGGVSETVQVLAYAAAPCVLAGVPVPALQLAVGSLAAGLYVYGIAVVHDCSVPRALVLGVVPAVAAYGYGFQTIGALPAAGGVLGL